MKFKMHERSLFATLLRNPWWVSLGVAILIALLSRLFLSGDFRIFGFTMAVPFAVIAAITLRKQLQAASAHADRISILYGGSMNAANATSLLAQPDVDGGLIGGAALKAPDFLSILASASC